MTLLYNYYVRLTVNNCVDTDTTLYLLLIDKRCSYLRSLNISDSGFILIKQNK
jgi:hypothetical protein